MRINYALGDTSYFIQKERPHFLILSPKQLFVFMSDERIGLGNSYTTVPPEFNNFANIFIESITSNVFLREHHFEYSPQNLLSRFYRTDAGFPHDYWSRILPLATSQEQMNVFEMEIKFQTEVEGILLLNGFVDFFRTHLYKNNGRVREFKIIDKHNNFEQNYVIEDKIEFQEIMFPQLSDNIVIKIISSYEGNRFTDICLSVIIPIYNAAMYREAKLYPELDYDSFIKEMFANYREVN